MSDLAAALLGELGDQELRALAERLAPFLRGQPATPASPWLDVDEAAEHLRCRPQRIYDLVSAGRLRVAKDGTRSLFRREWLDAHLLATGHAADASVRSAPATRSGPRDADTSGGPAHDGGPS